MKNIIFDLSKVQTEIPKNLKKFDPSYVTRYAITAELIRAHTKTTNKIRVLDVGGYNGALRDFLPEHDITILDMVEDKKLKNYVQASGADIPFEDDSFDVVVTCDTLEHVPAPERDKFMLELIRVSKGTVLLCAPFGTPLVEKAELEADSFYQSMAGESYIWLKEHKEFVLPKKEWLRKLLTSQNVNFDEFVHSSIDLWALLLSGSFFLAGNIEPVNKKLSERLRKTSEKYLQEVTFRDFPNGEGYRTFYVISKNDKPEVKLPSYSRPFIDEYFNEVIISIGSVIRDLNASYGAALYKNISMQELNENLNEQLQISNGELLSLKKRYDTLLNSKSYKFASGISKAKRRIRRV